MSITQEIKKEAVAGFSGSECCRTAFLSACLHTLGTLHFSREKGFTFVLTSECYEVLLFAAEELARKYGVKAEVSDKGRKTRKRKVYTVRLKDRDARLVLLELSILRINEAGQTEIVAGIDDYIIEDECCMRAYITGAFCGCGSFVRTRQKNRLSSGHVEFAMKSYRLASSLAEVIASFGPFTRLCERNNYFVVYIKDNKSVLGLLDIMGTNQQAEAYVRRVDERNKSNSANRQKNCQLANLDKTIDASIRQLEAIAKIESRVGLSALPANLYETAVVRKENPSLSIDQLAGLLHITKSGLSHRLRRIEAYAATLNV